MNNVLPLLQLVLSAASAAVCAGLCTRHLRRETPSPGLVTAMRGAFQLGLFSSLLGHGVTGILFQEPLLPVVIPVICAAWLMAWNALDRAAGLPISLEHLLSGITLKLLVLRGNILASVVMGLLLLPPLSDAQLPIAVPLACVIVWLAAAIVMPALASVFGLLRPAPAELSDAILRIARDEKAGIDRVFVGRWASVNALVSAVMRAVVISDRALAELSGPEAIMLATGHLRGLGATRALRFITVVMVCLPVVPVVFFRSLAAVLDVRAVVAISVAALALPFLFQRAITHGPEDTDEEFLRDADAWSTLRAKIDALNLVPADGAAPPRTPALQWTLFTALLPFVVDVLVLSMT